MSDYPAGRPFLVVDLFLTPTSEGGRRTAVGLGFRCPAWLDGAELVLPLHGRTITVPTFDCALFFDGRELDELRS
jgi:hypothetical protein